MKITKLSHHLLAGFMSASICSCGIVSVNESGYKHLSPEEKLRIKRCSVSIHDLSYDGNIYQIDANQMTDYLNEHNEVVIYEYASYCNSNNCISPKEAEKLCLSSGITFCIIVTTYDHIERIPTLEAPLLAIRQEAYKTDKTHVYCDMFFNQVTGVTDKERGYGRFYYFRNGKFIKSYENLNDLISSL